MQLKAINGIIALACATKALQRPRVIIAPAQFGVPKDYDDLSAARQLGHTVACAPLSRLSWLRIVPSVFTEAFFKGELKPQGTLDFFFEALDAAVADVGPDEDIARLGHSIGGWVARVGRRPGRAARQALRDAGHAAQRAPEGLFSNIDQTRGLLKYVRANCPPDPAIFTCVAGTATSTAALGDVFKLDVRDEELTTEPAARGAGLAAVLPGALREEPVRRQRRRPHPRGDGQCGNQPVRQAGLVVLFTILAASTQRESARRPRTGIAFHSPERLISAQATARLADCPSIEVDCHHSDFVPTALDSIRLPETYLVRSPAVFEARADALIIAAYAASSAGRRRRPSRGPARRLWTRVHELAALHLGPRQLAVFGRQRPAHAIPDPHRHREHRAGECYNADEGQRLAARGHRVGGVGGGCVARVQRLAIASIASSRCRAANECDHCGCRAGWCFGACPLRPVVSVQRSEIFKQRCCKVRGVVFLRTYRSQPARTAAPRAQTSALAACRTLARAKPHAAAPAAPHW